MKPTTILPLRSRRPLLAAVIALLTALSLGGPARAQTIVVVNGDPVTQFDIEQRSKFIEVSTHKVPTRNEVLEQLINDKLKIGLLKNTWLKSAPGEPELEPVKMPNSVTLMFWF